MAFTQPLGAQLQGGQELSYVNQRDPYAGSLLSRVVDAINQLAKNAGVAAVGKVSPPPPIDALNVQGSVSGSTHTAPSEILHWTIQHNQSVAKNIRYFSEVDTSPSFTNPHVVDHGASRSAFLTLPTNTTGNVKQTYYLRSYAQMPGSDPCVPTVYGGLGSPLGIQMTGTSKTTLLSSTGSGTAAANGSQGGHGLGVVLNRPAPQPKRSTL